VKDTGSGDRENQDTEASPDFQQKIDELRRKLSDQPDSADLCIRVGNLCLETDNRDEGVTFLIRAFNLNPNNKFLLAKLKAVCTEDELSRLHMPEEASFSTLYTRALTYPFTKQGFGCFVTLFIMNALLIAPGVFIMVIAMKIIIFGLLLTYLFDMIKQLITHPESTPQLRFYNLIDSVFNPILRLGIVWIFWFLPLIGYVLFCLTHSIIPNVGIVCLLMLLALTVFPMAMLVTVMFNTVTAGLNPTFVFSSIFRAGAAYWAVVFTIWAVVIVDFVVTLIFAFPMTLIIKPIYASYGIAVTGMLLAALYRAKEGDLAWF